MIIDILNVSNSYINNLELYILSNDCKNCIFFCILFVYVTYEAIKLNK